MCECELCTYHRHVEDVKGRGDVSQMRELIDELYELYSMTDFDLDYHKAIFDGSWPSAKEIALGIVERAEKFEEKQNEIERRREEDSVRRNHALQEGEQPVENVFAGGTHRGASPFVSTVQAEKGVEIF